MNSAALRQAFLGFFADKDHQVVPSAPLVPRNDPTLMFVNAGMVQFKDVFTGREQRDYQRACSSQKCIRISGKHNDLENVGVTARHHTFFEMLGNFSFGDYFKEAAIVYAWELLTKELALSPERMVVTVFEGDEDFPPDDEAAALWHKVSGLGQDRVLRLGAADNFWSMGPTGPCGPCSEIHYFHGDDVDPASFGPEPALDGSGWTEIWNLVFMQYERELGKAATPLPAPSIDTGAGLERLACVLQGVKSNYDSDVLRRLLGRIEDIASKKYGATAGDDDVSMRVIADHARTTAFLIAEGVMPDKQKREYVLRRVMRRAIRHGHRLGVDTLFMPQMANEVVDAMGADYPELVERKELIEQVVAGEETRFRATLRRGMKILDDRFAVLKGDQPTLPAEVAADLYTTYGFPLDLTELICAERSFGVDVDGAKTIISGAESADGPIDPAAAVDSVYRELVAELPATEFTGYTSDCGLTEVAAIVKLVPTSGDGDFERVRVQSAAAGDLIDVVLSRTPFYAEAGGQLGDQGTLRGEGDSGLQVDVSTTASPLGDLSFHRGTVRGGSLDVGDQVMAEVDRDKRQATCRNHSATHLLHWALREVLGEHAQQKGSLVGPDVLRFDFAHNQALSREQIGQVERLVNRKVLTNAPVQTEVLPIAEARARGAVAIFEEKYGDQVRVLTMSADSVELCGGTHCQALGQIGLFKILSEGGTAAGVRRIFAATGLNALARVQAVEDELRRARQAAKAQTGGDLAERIGKMWGREKQLEKRIKELDKKLLEGGGDGGGIEGMLAQAKVISGMKVLGQRVADGTSMASLREIAEKLRDKLGGEAVVLIGCAQGKKAQLALMVSKAATAKLKAGSLIKPIAKHVAGSGGGRPDMAQAGGGNPAGIDDAIAALYVEVESALS